MINKKIKEDSGVTLVVLVITIVVLAILLTATISAFMGNNGLINRIKKAKSDEEAAHIAGQEKIDSVKSEQKYTADGTIIKNYSDAIVIGDITITNQTTSGFDVNVYIESSYSGIKKVEYSCKNGIDGSYVIDENDERSTTYTYDDLEANTIYFVHVIVTDNNGNTATAETIGVTGAPREAATILGATHTTGTVNSGYVIEDANGNEWVWVPKSEAVLDVSYYEEDETNIKSAINKAIDAGKYPLAIKFNENDYRGIEYAFDYDSSEEENSFTYKGYTESGTYGLIGKYQELVTKDTTGEVVNDNVQELLNNTIKSIKKYGGFYIGRYGVTGTEDEPGVKANTNLITNSLGGTGISELSAYTVGRLIQVNDDIETSLVWGWQWDAMMIWFLQTFSKTYADLACQTSNVDHSIFNWGEYNKTTIMPSTDIVNNVCYVAGASNYTIGFDDNSNINGSRRGGIRSASSGTWQARAVIIIP